MLTADRVRLFSNRVYCRGVSSPDRACSIIAYDTDLINRRRQVLVNFLLDIAIIATCCILAEEH